MRFSSSASSSLRERRHAAPSPTPAPPRRACATDGPPLRSRSCARRAWTTWCCALRRSKSATSASPTMRAPRPRSGGRARRALAQALGAAAAAAARRSTTARGRRLVGPQRRAGASLRDFFNGVLEHAARGPRALARQTARTADWRALAGIDADSILRGAPGVCARGASCRPWASPAGAGGRLSMSRGSATGSGDGLLRRGARRRRLHALRLRQAAGARGRPAAAAHGDHARRRGHRQRPHRRARRAARRSSRRC